MAALPGIDQAPPRYAPLFRDREIDRIYAGAAEILFDKGFRIYSREILERLERRGARVDYASHIFQPSRAMLHELEQCARRCGAQTRETPLLRQPIPPGEGVVYNAPLYYDVGAGERRMADWQDVVAVLRTCHELPEVTRVGPALAAHDVPPATEPLAAVAEAIKTTHKEVLAVEMVLSGQLPFMEELETISRGRQVRYTSCGASIDRFTIDRRGAEMLAATWKRNGLEAWWVASCPTAGTTAPVTLAGAVVVGVAETLGGWFAGWVLNEGVTLGLSPCSSVLDMRTTRVLFSTPEAVLIDAGQFQVFERLFGIRGQMLADYTDAKIPGMQAMHDKLMKTLAFEWLTCGVINPHYGKLDAGKAFSPAQMVIDFEINRELAALRSGIPVTSETLALDLIREYALDHKRSFLQSEHTLGNFREALWRPILMDRSSWEGGEGEQKKDRQAVEAAEARWRGALAAYRPPEIAPEKIRAVDEVMRRAREALL